MRRVAPARPLAVLAGGLLVLLILGQAVDAPATEAWTRDLGMLAPIGYAVIYVVATLIGAPETPFALLSPFLFGAWTALAVVVVASALSAAAAFLIARHLARDALAKRLAGTTAFGRLAAVVESHDWMVIPLLRVLPVAPFAIVNYGFGLTGISFWRYLRWSLLTMVPMNALLVLGADQFERAAARGTVSWPLLGAAAALLVLALALAAAGRRAFVRS